MASESIAGCISSATGGERKASDGRSSMEGIVVNRSASSGVAKELMQLVVVLSINTAPGRCDPRSQLDLKGVILKVRARKH